MTEGHDFDRRGIGFDAQFITDNPLQDSALQAALWADKDCAGLFPGWSLYRLIAAHDRIHAEPVAAYAIAMACGLASARKAGGNSHQVVADRVQGDWIVQAGMDALYFTMWPGRGWPESATARAEWAGIHPDVYRRIRNAVAGGLLHAFECYRDRLGHHYLRARRIDSKI